MKTFTIVATDSNGNEFVEEYVAIDARSAVDQFIQDEGVVYIKYVFEGTEVEKQEYQ